MSLQHSSGHQRTQRDSQAGAMMTCPTCESLFAANRSRALPFCCERCRLADLNRWFDEEHGLPVEPSYDEE